MNVVFLPALSGTLIPAIVDGLFCIEGPCLLGWIWSILALTFASAWVVQRWTSGGDIDLVSRFAPAASVSGVAAIQPRVTGFASQADLATQVLRRTELAASGLALRAPPTTDIVSPACQPNRSTGTPTTRMSSGRTPPA